VRWPQVVFSLDGAEQASVAAAPYTWSWDTAGLIPGPYALTATATDAAGNTDAATIEVQVAGACRADGNCPPADVRIITPVDQAVVCGQFNIEAAATDDDLARIEFMVDNRPVGVAERSPFAVVWNTEGFDNGLHTITALAIDSADQRAFARVEVEVRNEPGVVCRQAPNINIVQPADGAFLNGQVPLEADASDDGVVVSVEFSVDNGRLDVVESVPWRSTWDTALFDEGAHTVKAKATDDTNDTATTQVQVTVDRTAPTVEVLTPSIGETFADRVPFALDVADNFAIDHVEVRLGGPDGQVLATLNVGPWEGELDTSAVASGDHELSAVVHDKVGLTSTASVDIRLDRAPMVSFVAPAAGATLEGPTTVEVSADDDLGVQSIELYVDDQLLDERAGQRFAEFRWEPPYRRGEHTLRAVATDSGGQTAEASLRVMVDHPFEVTITSPTDAQTVADTVTVNAETRDDDGQTQRVEFFVDGNLVGTDVTAPYEVDVDTTALPDGDRRLRARALSDNGQEADATVTVRVNNCDRDDDGYLGCGGADCDDRAFNVNPDAADRVGDGADQNCDDLDGVDDDGDGVASIGSGGGDCDDGDPLVVPGATDPVGDGVDQNCDRIDGVDADGDGYASIQSGGDDCSDADEVINPDAADRAGDAIDQNCDDVDGVDGDGDGYASVASQGEDCNDANAAIHPCADDRAGDGVDQNCDGADVQSCDDCNACTADTVNGAGCNHAAIGNGQLCDDGDACTQNERCQAGVCGNGAAVVCADDGDVCTAELCAPLTGCGRAPAADGTPCPGGACQGGACCVPQCNGRACGSDGCGGTCGDCAAGESCDANGACVEVPTVEGYVTIQPGVFTMGSPVNEAGRNNDERQHQVTLTRAFALKATEVTQGEWFAVMGRGRRGSRTVATIAPWSR
jgi:hypothetical protein